MILDLLNDLKSEDITARINALDELYKNVGVFDKQVVIKALKPLILDWDDDVRLRVAKVLEIYTGR